jgi:hypothetical protein
MNPKNIFIAVASVIGLGGILTIAGMATSWWISIEVANQLAAAGIVPEHEVEAVKTQVGQNTKDIVRVESKAERIAQILMED